MARHCRAREAAALKPLIKSQKGACLQTVHGRKKKGMEGIRVGLSGVAQLLSKHSSREIIRLQFQTHCERKNLDRHSLGTSPFSS